MLVVSLGDLVLDVVVRLHQPLARGADATSSVTLSTGGQAANVAAWVAELGGRSRWLGKRCDDDAGRMAATTLERLGVELAGPVEARGTGVIVALVERDGERSMCPDRGASGTFAPDELDRSWLECDHLHVSGYALLTSPLRETAIESVRLARRAGAQVSVDLSSWSGIRDAGPGAFRSDVVGLGPDVVFANEGELETVGGAWDGPIWIVKRGAAGCVFDGEAREAQPVEVVDTTGAGDALAAGWIVGGADLALSAAARCVARIGSMPAS
jgi:sugar/nucleoside kinase (ribokinase family)